MTRFPFLLVALALSLAACARHPAPLMPPPDAALVPGVQTESPPAEVRPVVQQDDIRGRWLISRVNGKAVDGLWLELGASGQAARAYLGCNTHQTGSWSRNGDKLFLAAPMVATEVACLDAAISAIERQALAILGLSMTMELTPPSALRLVNEAGTIDLVRPRS